MKNILQYLLSLSIILPFWACVQEDEIIIDNIFHNYTCDKSLMDLINSISRDSSEIRFDLKDFSLEMNQKSVGSIQGAACSGDYLFQFQNGHKFIYVYNIRTKMHIRTIEYNYDSSHHCNNANFGESFYNENDMFPLLYVSQQNNKIHKTLVYRLIGNSIENLELSLVQTIAGPKPSEDNHMFFQDCIIDGNNGYLYIYSHHKSEGGESLLYIAKYKLPDMLESEVYLTDKDLYSSFYFDNQFSSPQGAVCYHDWLFIVKGVPAWKEQVLLDIVNFTNKKVYTINLSNKGFDKEPEGLFVFEDRLYCATNNRGIYSLNLIQE